MVNSFYKHNRLDRLLKGKRLPHKQEDRNLGPKNPRKTQTDAVTTEEKDSESPEQAG